VGAPLLPTLRTCVFKLLSKFLVSCICRSKSRLAVWLTSRLRISVIFTLNDVVLLSNLCNDSPRCCTDVSSDNAGGRGGRGAPMPPRTPPRTDELVMSLNDIHLSYRRALQGDERQREYVVAAQRDEKR